MPDVTGDWSRSDEMDPETGYGPLWEAVYGKCNGKTRYASKEEALKAIAKMLDESFGGVGDLRPYKCSKKKCKGWHLTSNLK